jgi:glycerol-3-phosphate acyltransferase PlsY
VAATTVGERYGKTKIGDKSLEGTIAFVVTALCAGFILSVAGVHLATWVLITGSLVAAVVELLPLMVNDNLSIPIVSGAVMELALRWAR